MVKKVKRLDYLAAKRGYYYILNLACIFGFSSWYYCTCEKFQGCCLPNLEENYCFICQFKVEFNPYETEKIIEPLKIVEIYKSMKKKLKKMYRF